MKVWAGCFVDGSNPENLPTIHICASEKELVVALAEEARLDGSTCETMDTLSELLHPDDEDEDDFGDGSEYSGFSWKSKEL